jgi:hypothetical protein
MLDRRRTPIRVAAIRLETGTWSCEVLAFEDRGARWELPFERVTAFQFTRDAQALDRATLGQVRAAIRRFDRDGSQPLERSARGATTRRIGALRRLTAAWLTTESIAVAEGVRPEPASRDGIPSLAADLEAFMRLRGLWDIEQAVSATLVSHPGSGEVLKGHELALAGLGLAAYHGTVVRDPAILEGPWALGRRKAHIVTRLAFVREALTALGVGPPVLYRAISAEGPLAARRRGGLVHATFSLEVAMSLFGDPSDGTSARLDRQVVPLDRLFMTYLETAAMNRQFREAEAVLLGDPDNPSF